MPISIHETMGDTGEKSPERELEDGHAFVKEFRTPSGDRKVIISMTQTPEGKAPLSNFVRIYEIDVDDSFQGDTCDLAEGGIVDDNLVALLLPGGKHAVDFKNPDGDIRQMVIKAS